MSLFPNLRAANSIHRSESPIENAILEVEGTRHPRRRRFHFGSGAALVLMALIIISLLCFAALSIVSAQADRKLTQRYAQQITSYYNARNRSVRFEEKLQRELTKLVTLTNSEDDYVKAAAQLDYCVDPQDESGIWYSQLRNILALEAGSEQTDSTHSSMQQKGAENTPIFVYSTPINQNQTYLLVLRAQYPAAKGDPCYTVLSSKAVTTAVVDYDTSLDVLQR